MNKSVKTTQPIVAYLKISSYMKGYLQTKYGEIVSFPFSTRLYSTVFQYIVNNPSMSPVTPFSFSQKAFHYKREDSVFDIDVSLPPEDEREQFVAIELPAFVFRYGKEVPVTPFWQFSRKGSVEIRKLIHKEFWINCLEFIDECFVRARIGGTKVTRENAIADFMTINNIDMVWYETLVRYNNRFRQKIGKEIEMKRSEMEEFTDRQFCYT